MAESWIERRTCSSSQWQTQRSHQGDDFAISCLCLYLVSMLLGGWRMEGETEVELAGSKSWHHVQPSSSSGHGGPASSVLHVRCFSK